ncbi:hypothetical protein SEMRO_395_G134170.1 [Seminavis robusta]|uniref:Uncharacterized protein n=1 Tax=Seminavis robusta TaxID=568900 RepID=A0A9N8E0U8_9STRA|nr:hypothetical protein SEMRO_395_G134170.1 [Seminavis robusta]|eukprot:Sro395_g134170.1 n/a (142) ;mRNA; r:62507-62932
MLKRTFLLPPAEDGTRVKAKILERVKYHKEKVQQHPDMIKFKFRVNDEYEEIVAYNDIVDYIEKDQTWDATWKFRKRSWDPPRFPSNHLTRNDTRVHGSTYKLNGKPEKDNLGASYHPKTRWEYMSLIQSTGAIYVKSPVY